MKYYRVCSCFGGDLSAVYLAGSSQDAEIMWAKRFGFPNKFAASIATITILTFEQVARLKLKEYNQEPSQSLQP